MRIKIVDRIRNLFRSHDAKPVTVSMLLGRDACSRLLINFSERELVDCRALVVVWQHQDGSISMLADEGLESLKAAGMLSMAQVMISGSEGYVED